MKKHNLINTLQEQIKTAAQNYYTGNTTISDTDFDNMVDKLKELKPESDVVNSVGWGYDIDKVSGNKIKHKYGIVGSLDKVHSINEIPYTADCSLILSSKLDGASCVAYYINGKLDKAVSRGNGQVGIDCTEKFKKIIEKYSINTNNFTGAIRGEIVFSSEDWQKYLQQYPDAKFPRNVATGLFMRNDATDDLKYLSFVTYKLEGLECDIGDLTYSNILNTLRQFGFPVVQYTIKKLCDITEDFLINLFNNDWKLYPMDGIVLQDDFGVTIQNNCVNYKNIAYKFKAEEKETTVTGVEWNLSKNNIYVPIVCVEPVELSGAVVSKASGFNYKYIVENKIGKGAKIKLMRSGEVIPKITEILKPSNDLNIPEKCPVCGNALVVDGVELLCINDSCRNKEYARLVNWIQIIGIRDLLGIGKALIDSFIEIWQNVVKDLYNYAEPLTVMDIYNDVIGIKNNKATILSKFTPITGKKFEIVMNNLYLPITTDKALLACNIRGLGQVVCEKLQDIIYDYIKENKYEYLTKIHTIPGIGVELENQVLNNRDLIHKLLINVILLHPVKTGFSTEYIKICVTGSLSLPRKQFIEKCAAKNIKVTDNVAGCKYLVTNNPNSGSSKLKKASKLGIPVITEAQFIEQEINNANK